MHPKVFFVSVILTCIICACSNVQLEDDVSPLEKSFLKLIAVDDVNDSLHVDIVYDERTEYKYGDDIVVLIKNTSNQEIFLPSKPSALRAFVLSDNSWVEVKNDITYLGDGVVLAASEDALSQLINGIRPVINSELEGFGNEVNVRVLIMGEFIVNEKKTGTVIAAFADLVMRK